MEEKKKLVLKISLIIILFSVFLYFVYSNLWISPAPPKRVVCGAGLKQLSTCCMYYKHNEGRLPASYNWCDLLQPYIEPDIAPILDSFFQCPKDKTGPCSYAINENILADANILPGDLVLFFESAPGWNQVGGPDDVVTDRHPQFGANIAFADGHVEFVKPEDIPHLRWTAEGQ